MWNIVIGAVAGGVAGAVTSYLNASKRADAYREAAEAMEKAAEEYSGSKAYNSIVQKGSQEGRTQANAFGMGNDALNGSLAMNNTNGNNAASIYAQGNTAGRGMEAENLDTKYRNAIAQSKLNLEQANREANVGQQATQEIFKTAGGLADLYKNAVGNNNNAK